MRMNANTWAFCPLILIMVCTGWWFITTLNSMGLFRAILLFFSKHYCYYLNELYWFRHQQKLWCLYWTLRRDAVFHFRWVPVIIYHFNKCRWAKIHWSEISGKLTELKKKTKTKKPQTQSLPMNKTHQEVPFQTSFHVASFHFNKVLHVCMTKSFVKLWNNI